MSTIPGLGLGIEQVSGQLIEVVDDGTCGGEDYTALWLSGKDYCGDPETLTEQPAGILSFLMYYPMAEHPLGGYVISQHEPGMMLSMFQGLELREEDLAVEGAQNALPRQALIDAAKAKGGLVAQASETCEKRHIPLAAVVLWAEKDDDPEPSFASFHSLTVLPPEQALKALKFAVWQRMER